VYDRLRPELLARNPIPLPATVVAPFELPSTRIPFVCDYHVGDEILSSDRMGPLMEAALRLHTYYIPMLAKLIDHRHIKTCAELPVAMHSLGINLRYVHLVSERVSE